jgi:hypothetical protein
MNTVHLVHLCIVEVLLLSRGAKSEMDRHHFTGWPIMDEKYLSLQIG